MSDDDPERTEALGGPGSPVNHRVVVGDVLGGRYHVRHVLGRGGMATVWRAEDHVLHRDVAIKIFDGSAALPDASARTVAEVRLLAGLSHPGLVAVYDAGAHDDSGDQFDFLVMELADGPTLRQRLDHGRLAEHEVAVIGGQLAAALDYVHGRGVVHRDVKPANILLVGRPEHPQAKLTDFGIARVLGNDRLTMDGTTLGTANYLSPEQATGREVGPPSDVYALGLVLLECLTGVLAYEGHGVEAASARLHRPPFFPAWLGDGWQDLLGAMTRLDPATRPPLPDVTRALAAIASGGSATAAFATGPGAAARTASMHGGALPTAWLGASSAANDFAGDGGTTVMPPGTAGAEPRRRRGLLLAFGIVGLVIGLGAALALLLGSTGSPAPRSSSPVPSPAARSAPARSTASSPSARSGTSASRQSSTSTATTPTVTTTQPAGPGGKPPQPGKTNKPPKHGPAKGPGKSKGPDPGKP